MESLHRVKDVHVISRCFCNSTRVPDSGGEKLSCTLSHNTHHVDASVPSWQRKINTQTYSPNTGMLVPSPKGSMGPSLPPGSCAFVWCFPILYSGLDCVSNSMWQWEHVSSRTKTLGHLSFSDHLLKGGGARWDWMMGLLRNCCLWPWGSKERGQPTSMWVALQVDHPVLVTAGLADSLTKSSWGHCSWIPGL